MTNSNMTMTRKTLIALVSLGIALAGIGYIARGKESEETVRERKVDEQKKVLRKIIETRGNTLSYEEINLLGKTLNHRAQENPGKVKSYLIDAGELALKKGYGSEVFDNFNFRESMYIANGVLKSKARNGLHESEELGRDFVDRFSESDYYKNYLKKHEEMTKDVAKKIEETKIYDRLSDFCDGFYDNIRRRVLGEQ